MGVLGDISRVNLQERTGVLSGSLWPKFLHRWVEGSGWGKKLCWAPFGTGDGAGRLSWSCGTQTGWHTLIHPGSGGMGAQCPGATLCSAPWATLGCSLGGGSASHVNSSFPKAWMHLLNKQKLGHCLWRAVQYSSHFSCDTSFFQNISWSWAPSSGCGNIQVWICSVWAGLSPVV